MSWVFEMGFMLGAVGVVGVKWRVWCGVVWCGYVRNEVVEKFVMKI